MGLQIQLLGISMEENIVIEISNSSVLSSPIFYITD